MLERNDGCSSHMQLEKETLRFDQVTLAPDVNYESALCEVSFVLRAGDLLLVLLERENEKLPLADAAEGLITPLHGEVRRSRQNWETMTAEAAANHRGRIGRVFENSGWINDLDVDENIILAQLHHTDRAESEIVSEAEELARLFELPGLPAGRPSAIRRQDLRKAACIRAFLGQPELILLENPSRDVYEDIIAPLVNMVQGARQRGVAVLWMTSEPEVWRNPGIRANLRAKMFGARLHLLEPGAEVERNGETL